MALFQQEGPHLCLLQSVQHAHFALGNLDCQMTTLKHEENCKKLVQQPTILQATSTRESLSDKLAKKGEIQMAIFIAEHNLPIAVANHLPKFIQQV